MNHIILTNGTHYETSQESGSTFTIPLKSKDEFKGLISKITDESVDTILIATEEDVVVEKQSNLQLDTLSLQSENNDDGNNTYVAILKCRQADKTMQRLAEQQESINDLSTIVASLMYGEDGEDA